MGMTIHWTITPKKSWTWNETIEKFRAVHAYAATLPVQKISDDLIFLNGKECHYDHEKDKENPLDWFKIQSDRSVEFDSRPGTSYVQDPSKIAGFSVYPGEGSEEANFIMSEFPDFVSDLETEPQRDSNGNIVTPYLNYWDEALNPKRSKHYPKERKTIRAWMKKYGLKKRDSKSMFYSKYGATREPLNHPDDVLYRLTVPSDYLPINVVTVCYDYKAYKKDSPYKAFRAEYPDRQVIICYIDPARHIFCGSEQILSFVFICSAEEAARIVATQEFQDDLSVIAFGNKKEVCPGCVQSSSCCKTIYANNEAYGGIQNFLRCHLSIVSILDKFKELGFGIDVYDEGHYFENRNVGELMEAAGSDLIMLAGFFGAFKDALDGSDMKVVSPITESPDFEHLEAKAIQLENYPLTELIKILSKEKKVKK